MRITYSKNDPRAGMTVEMADEDLARRLIDSGAATKASSADAAAASREATAPAVEATPPTKTTARKTAKKAR